MHSPQCTLSLVQNMKQCSVQCTDIWHPAEHCTAHIEHALQYIALHCTAGYWSELHSTALHCTELTALQMYRSLFCARSFQYFSVHGLFSQHFKVAPPVCTKNLNIKNVLVHFTVISPPFLFHFSSLCLLEVCLFADLTFAEFPGVSQHTADPRRADFLPAENTLAKASLIYYIHS